MINYYLEGILKIVCIKSKLFNRISLFTFFLMAPVAISFAQGKQVSGVVIDAETKDPLPGVSISIAGTTIGASSDGNGGFSLNVPSDQNELVFSYIGYTTYRVTVGNQSVINVTLVPDIKSLNEVVVTALGIEKETKSLSYSLQQINGKELTVAKDANLMNSLAGKVAGITINRSASGVGGSVRVVLRGNKSTQSNSPLYVIDGIPMLNTTPSQPADVYGQAPNSGGVGRDGGDGISNLNPEDIESINILKGASAAALYGSQAANGVILVTTKKGKSGQTQINFSSNLTIEKPLLLLELSYKYGQTDPAKGTADSWGAIVNAPDHVKGFFQTGTTLTNSISLSGGNEKSQTYFSYSNTTNKGIMPTSTFDRHTISLRESAKFLDDKLTVEASANLLTQKAHNRPISGLYSNPLTGLYL